MQDWLDRLAETLGEPPLSEAETIRLLAASREVAHRVERKTTPLAAFLLGAAVGRGLAVGADRAETLETVFAKLEGLLPGRPGESASSDRG